MIAYSEGKRTVLGDPIIRRYSWVHKKEDGIRQRISLKAYLCRYNALGVWRLIDRAYRHGRELCAVFTVKYDSVDRIRIALARAPVDHHVSDGDFSPQTLSRRLGVDDPREPIKVVGIVIFRAVYK